MGGSVKTVLKFFGLIVVLVTIFWLIWNPSPQEPGYIFVSAWGEFNDPIGIAVSDTEVYVSDSRHRKIQVFDFDGNFRRAFGEKELGRPMNLTIHEQELYVADYWNDKIFIYSLDGKLRRSIGQAGKGPFEFDGVAGVAVNNKGELFVADFSNQRIQHLRANGEFIEQWGTTKKVGIKAGEMNYPTDVAIAADGSLYVADGYNDRIQVFSSEGEFLHKWGGPFALNISGSGPGWFATVSSVAIGPQGNVFATDFYNNRVQKFAPDGTFLSAFGEKGTGSGQFDRPVAVAVAKDGTVFVTDLGNNRVQKWRAKP